MTATATSALDAIRANPVAFCEEVLGFEPWSKQRRVLESVRDNRRTAVRSGNGAGKTLTAAHAAIRRVFSHFVLHDGRDGRGVKLPPTNRTVNPQGDYSLVVEPVPHAHMLLTERVLIDNETGATLEAEKLAKVPLQIAPGGNTQRSE